MICPVCGRDRGNREPHRPGCSVLAAETEYGGFSIKQGGVVVAGGSGPYEAIKSEAAHYAAIYGQDGSVKVRVWKNRRKAAA